MVQILHRLGAPAASGNAGHTVVLRREGLEIVIDVAGVQAIEPLVLGEQATEVELDLGGALEDLGLCIGEREAAKAIRVRPQYLDHPPD